MTIKQDFRPLELNKLVETSNQFKEDGFRLAQLHPILEHDDYITLVYTFIKDAQVVNFKITGIQKGVTEVPSVTELFLAAFVFENEAHDLFGVNVVGNLLDFKGKFYAFGEGVEAPMTIISPEQLAAREKAAKVAAAKAARAAKAAKTSEGATSSPSNADEELEEKLAGMDPEKAAKVRAAMKAKAEKAAKKAESEKAAQQAAALEEKLAGMDPEKAAKVRAAMEAKAKKAAAKATEQKEGE